MTDPPNNQQSGRSGPGWGCGILIVAPIILLVCPLPEAPITAYPVYGNSSFEVLNHREIVSLGAFEQYDQSGCGMKGSFRVWVDVPNERWGDPVTLKCNKVEYRLNGSEWRNAQRTPEGDYRGGGSARIWFWSPVIQDLDLLDASSKSYRMRQGSYDLRLEFEADNGVRKTIETTLTLREKTVRRWRSVLDNLSELSGIN